jgi:Putative transposase
LFDEAVGRRHHAVIWLVSMHLPAIQSLRLATTTAPLALHAAARCEAEDRKRLVQLCRYITRPALANERAQANAAGVHAASSCTGAAAKVVLSDARFKALNLADHMPGLGVGQVLTDVIALP